MGHDKYDMNPAWRLHELGQSLWLHSISRAMLRSGALERNVNELRVTGLTSNPTILAHAMAVSTDYDASLAPGELVYSLTLEDLGKAAWLFYPAWERSFRIDGYVSLEAGTTLALAQQLHDQAGLPNLLVKIPGTPQGLPAREEANAAGIGVNVTLLFSDNQYLGAADAYIRALERRGRDGLNLFVPSIFISRWDAKVDPLLPPDLPGRLGLAVAQKSCSSHLGLLSDKRWQALAERGARPQRLLWASISAQDPDFPNSYYLGRLAAPDTIDTVPEKTLLACADPGSLDDRLHADYARAERTISALAERLQREGAEAFSADGAALLDAIGGKAEGMRESRPVT
jgi:transaldolase